MNECKNKVSTMYHNIPAVAALNHVPGFDPVKLLRRARSRKTNEEVLKLALPYKKLWFRLANPKGRIRLNALRVTEQLAVYEALVYLDRSDTEPVSNFTASCTREDAPDGDYITAAQEEAMDEALSGAGFGLQFADVGMTKKAEYYGSEIPITEMSGNGSMSAAVPTAVKEVGAVTITSKEKAVVPSTTTKAMVTVGQAESHKIPLQMGYNVASEKRIVQSAKMAASQPVAEEKLPVPETRKEVLPVLPAVQKYTVPAEQEKDTLPVPSTMEMQKIHTEKTVGATEVPVNQEEYVKQDVSEAQRAARILHMNSAAEIARDAETATAAEVLPVGEPASKYTRDMPVEEILKVMTFEDAKKVVVDTGTCNGWTIAEVAARRAPSLKFYLYGGYKGDNNILRAAAKIMLDYLESQKANRAG